MVIADIKKFIDNKQEEMYYADKGDYFIPPNDVGEILEVILNMLDELDRPNEVKLMCPRCKHERQKPITEFCGNCGETMEVIEIYYTKGEKELKQ